MANGPFFFSVGGLGNGVLRVPARFPAEWGVKSQSNILAAATELDGNGNPLFGDASIQVLNIVPEDNGVQLFINILWGAPINWRVAFVIWP
jgi:hypothetical protein